jgi:site-specific DNA-methyltransferase (adenine-specific)
MNIQQISINDLKPYPQNAKKHPSEQVEHIANSIREFGFQQPIVVDKDNVVVIGHGRLLAAKKLNMDSVPCVRADDLTDEQIKALRLADNKTNESEWDFDLLDMELSDIEIDMEQFGFDLDIDDEPQEVVEDEVPEEVETRCKIGDLWQLGSHKLVCGDSTDPAVIDRLMDGVKAKLLLTDPPYGIKADKGFSGAGGFSGKGKPIERRHYKDEWDSERPKKDVFDHICLMAENAIIFGGNFFTDELPVGNHWLVWNKHNTMPTFSDAELAWTNIKRNSVKIYDVEWNGLIGKEKERFHPTQKPVKLFADILNDYTKENDSVLDCFGGSGSTLIACEQLNRKCYMCELDEHYCSVIIQRWEKFTGEKAVLLNG